MFFYVYLRKIKHMKNLQKRFEAAAKKFYKKFEYVAEWYGEDDLVDINEGFLFVDIKDFLCFINKNIDYKILLIWYDLVEFYKVTKINFKTFIKLYESFIIEHNGYNHELFVKYINQNDNKKAHSKVS